MMIDEAHSYSPGVGLSPDSSRAVNTQLPELVLRLFNSPIEFSQHHRAYRINERVILIRALDGDAQRLTFRHIQVLEL